MSSPPIPQALAEAMNTQALRADYRGQRVCVTGGAGFIGSHLVDSLLRVGAAVSILDDLSSGRRSNLVAAEEAELVEGSILDDDALDAAMGGARVVFHQAALGSVPASLEEPRRYLQTNAMGTLAVLEAARRHRVECVVYAASSSAYGDQAESPKIESMRPDPLSPYAASKLAGESLLRCYAHCYGLSTVSLRYFNVFGPRQRADSDYAAVVPRFVAALRAGEAPTIYGDGEQTRDFTPVANAVYANLLAGAAPRRWAGEVVNIAGGRAVSLLELLSLIRGMLPSAAVGATHHAPARTGDVRHSVASIDAARELLGYRPLVEVEEGLRLTITPP